LNPFKIINSFGDDSNLIIPETVIFSKN